MKAIQFRRYGPSDVLEYVERDLPSPADHQCLVKVSASSVNPIDWKIRKGKLKMVLRPRFPMVLGFDICGEIVATGRLVSKFKAGDWVYALLESKGGGAHAEYAVVAESAAGLKPEQLTPQESAAIPLAALTAIQALRDKGRLCAGQRVLIIGASGGVGHFAVQIAKAIGAHVTAVCGTTNVEMVRDLGADRVMDYKTEDYKQDNATYDIVFDVVAADSFLGCSNLLGPTGIYISTLPSCGLILATLLLPVVSKKRSRFILVQPSGDDLTYLRQLVAGGRLRPVTDRVYPLAEAKAAHDYSEKGHTRGKIILQVTPAT